MLNHKIKETVDDLSSFDKALLIQYLFNSLNRNEDPDILSAWIEESESRLKAIRDGKLGIIEYSELKKKVI